MNLIKNHYKDFQLDPKNISVAFQGSEGSFSETALLNFFGDQVRRTAYDNFSYVYEALSESKIDFAILPIENTLIGTIHPSFDLLAKYRDLVVIADHTLRIEHALIGLSDTVLNKVTTVYSQAPGLAQCDVFLNNYRHWKRIPFGDTAAAVKLVADLQDPKHVAIASERAADIHNLKVLQRNIESNQNNYTRFVIVVRKNSDIYIKWLDFMNNLQINKKISHNVALAIFSTADDPGALLKCLKVFESYKINLHKIESRPIIGKPWEYMFTVEMDITNLDISNAIDSLTHVTKDLHIIGTYHRLAADYIPT